MRVLIDEYGKAVYYALAAFICIVLFIAATGLLFSNGGDYVLKNAVYTSDSYTPVEDSTEVNEAVAPNINIKNRVVVIKKGDSKYSSGNIKSTLESLGIYEVSNYETISLDGNVNVNKIGSYDITITATNHRYTTTDNITVIVDSVGYNY